MMLAESFKRKFLFVLCDKDEVYGQVMSFHICEQLFIGMGWCFCLKCPLKSFIVTKLSLFRVGVVQTLLDFLRS